MDKTDIQKMISSCERTRRLAGEKSAEAPSQSFSHAYHAGWVDALELIIDVLITHLEKEDSSDDSE